MENTKSVRPADLRQMMPGESRQYPFEQWKYVRTMVYRENQRRRKRRILAEIIINQTKLTCCIPAGAWYMNAPSANTALLAAMQEYAKDGSTVVVTLDPKLTKMEVFRWG